jgi:sortase A
VITAETPEKSRRTRIVLTALDVVGRTMIATGVLLLLFVAYQLWGTGLAESRSQSALADEFETVISTPVTQSTLPAYGDVISRIEIPKIGVDVAITGHRTTYGAPFSRIDEIGVGDEVIVQTADGTFTYVVNAEPFVVEPTQTEVAKTLDRDKATLTLISCHPRWTSEKRIVVTADLVPTQEPSAPTEFVAQDVTEIPDALSEGWFHDPAAWPWVIVLLVVLIALYVGAIFATRRGVRAYISYPVMAVVMFPVLFVFFGQLSRLLPTGI